jgi:hypothetical protein
MYGAELLIWDRFLFAQGDRARDCQYDVHVGNVRELPPTSTPEDRRLWESLSSKRIDVVCMWDGILWLVEVKETQSMGGLGQVLSYVSLWNSEGRTEGPARPLLVCGRLDPDLRGVYEYSHVEVVCV